VEGGKWGGDINLLLHVLKDVAHVEQVYLVKARLVIMPLM